MTGRIMQDYADLFSLGMVKIIQKGDQSVLLITSSLLPRTYRIFSGLSSPS